MKIINSPPRPQIEFPAFDIVSVVALEAATLVLELAHVSFAQILEEKNQIIIIIISGVAK